MRETLYSGLGGLVAASGYFLLLDFVRPTMKEYHMVFWWLILGLYVAVLFGVGCRSVLRTKPGMVGTGFVLLAATAYLYDPAIESRLASNGLGWLWVVSLGGFFLWIFAFSKGVRNRDQQKSS
jgi:hypothetical protein